MQFDKVAIGDEVVRADLLSVEYVDTPHTCELQALGNVLVHQPGDIEHRAAATHREGFAVIRRFTRRLGVDTDTAAAVPTQLPRNARRVE